MVGKLLEFKHIFVAHLKDISWILFLHSADKLIVK